MYRPVSDSVREVAAPPAHVAELERALDVLRGRYPDATFRRYLDRIPQVDASAYVAPTAVLIGDVELCARASVWPGCVLRADLSTIRVGARSNLQDGTVVHLGDDHPTLVGDDVVVGHRAVLHGCRLEDACLIGIGAIVLDGAVIGEGSIVGAGAMVRAGERIPPRSLVLGTPAKVTRTLDASEERHHREMAQKYVRLATNHRFG